MSAVIAVPYYSTWRGKYLLWATSPAEVISNLLGIVNRDGVTKASKRLTDRSAWNRVAFDEPKELASYLNTDRFLPVEGYGIACVEDALDEDWISPKSEHFGATQCYVLTENSLMVYDRCDDEWVLKVEVPYDANDDDIKLAAVAALT